MNNCQCLTIELNVGTTSTSSLVSNSTFDRSSLFPARRAILFDFVSFWLLSESNKTFDVPHLKYVYKATDYEAILNTYAHKQIHVMSASEALVPTVKHSQPIEHWNYSVF